MSPIHCHHAPRQYFWRNGAKRPLLSTLHLIQSSKIHTRLHPVSLPPSLYLPNLLHLRLAEHLGNKAWLHLKNHL